MLSYACEYSSLSVSAGVGEERGWLRSSLSGQRGVGVGFLSFSFLLNILASGGSWPPWDGVQGGVDGGSGNILSHLGICCPKPKSTVLCASPPSQGPFALHGDGEFDSPGCSWPLAIYQGYRMVCSQRNSVSFICCLSVSTEASILTSSMPVSHHHYPRGAIRVVCWEVAPVRTGADEMAKVGRDFFILPIL